jgi:hypothetical protein
MILSFVMIFFGYTLVSSIICAKLELGVHMRCIRLLSKTEYDTLADLVVRSAMLIPRMCRYLGGAASAA